MSLEAHLHEVHLRRPIAVLTKMVAASTVVTIGLPAQGARQALPAEVLLGDAVTEEADDVSCKVRSRCPWCM